MRLKDKVSLITGGGSGIGKATAKLFAREGAKVVVADIDINAGSEVAQQITGDGGEATFIQVDVSHAADAERMVQRAIDSYGRLDILFNNAGILGEPLDKLTEQRWRREIDIMLTGPYLACSYAIPLMKRQGNGNILNTSSIAAFSAGGRGPAYATAKSGLLMLTKYLARALAKNNIRVNCICPGSVDTNLSRVLSEEEQRARQANRFSNVPMGRAARPEEIASVALFLVSDESSYVTGAALVVDGGASL